LLPCVAMQRIVSNATARNLARCETYRLAAMLTSCRLSSSGVPLTVRPPTAAGAARADESAQGNGSPAQVTAPELDAKAAAQVRLARDMGEQAFGENTEILKVIGYRGLRAFVVCAIGLGAFMWAMKKKKAELAAGEANATDDDEDPTQRYLEEMRSLGFDVDTLEEELEQERLAKLAAAKEAKCTP
jgi:nitrogen fixation-related uncharacterized protein